MEEFPTFAPVVMAGISPHLPDCDTASRTLVVVLLPDAYGVAEDSDWEEIEPDARDLAEWVVQWAETVILDLPKPELPNGVRGRAKERWRPLWRVAHAAGGDWPARCLALIERETDELDSDKEEGLMRTHPAIALLRDVAEEWPEGLDVWPTESIRLALVTRHPDRWGVSGTYPKGLTVQRIGRYLGRSFRVRTLKSSDGSRIGYAAADIARVCGRLGIPSPSHVTAGTVQSAETAPRVDVHRP